MFAPVLGQMASWMSATSTVGPITAIAALGDFSGGFFWLVVLILGVVAACELAGLRYIANNRVGIVEKLWSVKGSVTEGRIIALSRRGGISSRDACEAAFISVTGGGNSGFTGCRWFRFRRERSAMSTPATAKRFCRARRWAR